MFRLCFFPAFGCGGVRSGVIVGCGPWLRTGSRVFLHSPARSRATSASTAPPWALGRYRSSSSHLGAFLLRMYRCRRLGCRRLGGLRLRLQIRINRLQGTLARTGDPWLRRVLLFRTSRFATASKPSCHVALVTQPRRQEQCPFGFARLYPWPDPLPPETGRPIVHVLRFLVWPTQSGPSIRPVPVARKPRQSDSALCWQATRRNNGN